MGIAIDFLVVLFLAASTWRGWRMGLLYQLGQVALVIVAYAVARGLGSALADPLRSGPGLPPSVASTVGFFVVFIVVVAVGGFFLRRMTRDLLGFSTGLGQLDKILGLVVGAAKGALIAYIAIVGLLMAHRMTGKVPLPFADSTAGRWVMRNNFLDSEEFPRARALAKLAWVATTRSQAELASDPHLRALLAHPKTQSLLTPEVLSALGNKDFIALLGEDAVWDFLDEPEVQQHLNAIEWIEIEAPASDAAPHAPGGTEGPLHP